VENANAEQPWGLGLGLGLGLDIRYLVSTLESRYPNIQISRYPDTGLGIWPLASSLPLPLPSTAHCHVPMSSPLLSTPLILLALTVSAIFALSFYLLEIRSVHQDQHSHKLSNLSNKASLALPAISPQHHLDKHIYNTASPRPVHSDAPTSDPILSPPVRHPQSSEDSQSSQTNPTVTVKVNNDKKKEKKNNTNKPKPKPKPSPKEKKKKMRNPYWTPEILDIDSDWGSKGEWKFIEMMYTPKKIMLKKDRRVIFPNISIPVPSRATMLPLGTSYDLSETSTDSFSTSTNRLRASINSDTGSSINNGSIAVQQSLTQLHSHLFYTHPDYQSSSIPLDEALLSLSKDPRCSQTPLFLTMATVGDALYWQLLENFVYTLSRFQLLSCAAIICVSDKRCMEMCRAQAFPCYDYRSPGNYPSTMEHIAVLKLHVLPKVLLKNVDVFLLDLDVGFLADPQYILQAYRHTPIVDIFVQVIAHM
jgi:hypothetical protein